MSEVNGKGRRIWKFFSLAVETGGRGIALNSLYLRNDFIVTSEWSEYKSKLLTVEPVGLLMLWWESYTCFMSWLHKMGL